MDKKSEKKLGLIVAGVMVVVVAVLLWLVMKPTPAQKSAAADSQGKTSSGLVSKAAGTGLKTDAEYVSAYAKVNKDFSFTSWYTPDLKVASGSVQYKNSKALANAATPAAIFEKWLEKYPTRNGTDTRWGKKMPTGVEDAKEHAGLTPQMLIDKDAQGKLTAVSLMNGPTSGIAKSKLMSLRTSLKSRFANGKTMSLAEFLKMMGVPPMHAELKIHNVGAVPGDGSDENMQTVNGGQFWTLNWPQASGQLTAGALIAKALDGQVVSVTIHAPMSEQPLVLGKDIS